MRQNRRPCSSWVRPAQREFLPPKGASSRVRCVGGPSFEREGNLRLTLKTHRRKVAA
jgi:hypothetical protein